MIGFDPTDENTAFLVEGSNTTYVAAYGNNTATSYVRLYGNSQSNSGYIFGISNFTPSNPCFQLGEVSNTSNLAASDMVIYDHKIGVGLTTPAYTLDVNGNINITSGFHKNGTYLPIDSWNVGNTGTRIYTTSNVGIGVVNPLRPLHVKTGAMSILQQYGEAAVLGGSLSILDGVNDSYRFISALDNSITSFDSRFIAFGKTLGMHNQAELSYTHISNGNTSNYLGLGLYGGVYAVVSGSGNVGIGTVYPSSKLNVAGGATIGTSFSNVQADSNTLLVAEKLGIGTTNPQASIHTTSDAIVGTLRAYGEIVSFADMSDASLKEHLVPLTNCLDKFDKLYPVEFSWRQDIFNKERRGTRDIGLIAQNVEAVLPHVVGTMIAPAPDSGAIEQFTEYKTVKYEKIVPYLVQAVRELTAKVAELEKQLTK